MSETPQQWISAIGRRIEQAELGERENVKSVARIGNREVVRATPVDTGLARSNWIASPGAPASFSRSTPFAPLPQGTDSRKFNETANANAAIQENERAIDQRQSEQVLNITNNVSYVQRLNDGSSVQAAAGFVQRAIQASRIAASRLMIFVTRRT